MQVRGLIFICQLFGLRFHSQDLIGNSPLSARQFLWCEFGELGIGSTNNRYLIFWYIEGYCENIPQGKVTVELLVGRCPGESLGKAYIGWSLVSRIKLEEVSRAQTWSLPSPALKMTFKHCAVHHALSIMHWASWTAHRYQVINWISVGFQAKDEVNSYYERF